MVDIQTDMSVAEIQRLLKAQQGKVNSLHKRREQLLEKLEKVEQEIASLSGGDSGGGVRFRNESSLEEVILEVLKKNKKGLGLSELTDAVEATGYQSSSANFKNVVYQNVYKSEQITRDEKSGKYVLA
ncbi:hypothetical protein [Rubinisphaera italica]|uniref:HTH HARE-type domain-containing protein n=1 Tax=Rubinisphaera italica TaxID=2527969 RepID=A0A5C5XFD9_9PLAN|nr:hypothetical protein [Rubinisphaera italica]TWT61073.1 hypothetical protein Pan54_18070 [Rubinisphaera italica]